MGADMLRQRELEMLTARAVVVRTGRGSNADRRSGDDSTAQRQGCNKADHFLPDMKTTQARSLQCCP